jgi:hypothetical protein
MHSGTFLLFVVHFRSPSEINNRGNGKYHAAAGRAAFATERVFPAARQ